MKWELFKNYKSRSNPVVKERIAEELSRLSPNVRREIFEMAEGKMIPFVSYATDPAAVKAAIKYVEEKGPVTFRELRGFLVKETSVKDKKEKYRFGIVRKDGHDGIFDVDSEGDKPDWKIGLAEPGGRKIAEFLDDDYTDVKPWEIPLLAGLQLNNPVVEPMSILALSGGDGMLLEEWKEKARGYYGGKQGDFKVGYARAWLGRLGLLKSEQEGKKKRYELDLPYDF